MKSTRPALDVSMLPTVTFGHRSLMWWGTILFMTIEGWTLLLTAMSYLYLRQNFESWPPPRVANPDLLIPVINIVVMLVSLIFAWRARAFARRLDHRGVTRALVISAAFGIAILALRWFELWALNIRWDTNGYGSVAWLVVGFHTTLLLTDVGDTIGLAYLFATRAMPAHYYSDVCDNSQYWFFAVGSWLPMFALVFLGPYVL